MIKFCARGYKFTIPELLLNNNPDTLLYNLNVSVQPVDMYDDHIFVDMDPKYIDIVLDYYRFGKEYIDKFYLSKDKNQHDIYLNMTLQYMGITDCSYIGNPVMVYPLVYDKKDDNDNSYVESKYKYCKIHTSDNNKIVVHIDNTWIDSKLKRILNGMIQGYIIRESGNVVYIWIELNNDYINKILSIMRDGLNIYGYVYEEKTYECESEYDDEFNVSDHNEKLIFYLRHYGLANDNIEKQLRNRINRYNMIVQNYSEDYYDVDINGKSYFFDQYDNIMLFTKEECDRKKCVIYVGRYRYILLKRISGESIELHNFFSPYFNKPINFDRGSSVAMELDEELVKKLTVHIKNYFCGL